MQAELSRALARARSDEPLDERDVLSILATSDEDLGAVLEAARARRDSHLASAGLHGIVTYSRKVFIPLTRLCRYRCSYCTFVQAHGDYMTLDEVLEVARAGREWGCTEALFTLGEAPEVRHPEAARWLSEHGFASTVEYVVHAAREVVLTTGLLPHANPGAVTLQEMARLRDVTASQGVMMEELADRLLRPGEAHAGAAGKAEAIRLEQLAVAAATMTPFTTGLLIGIGETLAERAHTIAAIAAADAGQIQEVIVQNFRAKPDTPFRAKPDAETADMLRTIAATRLALHTRVSVQAPPNLTPAGDGPKGRAGGQTGDGPKGRVGGQTGDGPKGRAGGQTGYPVYLDAGINDWGGVSPVTPDHVNPEMPWPSIDELADACEQHGFALRQRLPVYPRYLNEDWIAKPMWRHVLAAGDGMGLAREERWYAGEGWVPAQRAAQPVPKRRALAIASNHPERTAEDVSDDYGTTAGCGDAGGTGHVGFDEMLPDVPSRTVLAHERADLGTSWLAPYRRTQSSPSAPVRDALSRAHQGERLDESRVELLLRAEGRDLDAVISKADEIRREMVGDDVTYVVNRNITYTNFCHTGCGFCGFARPLGHDDGYAFDPSTIGRKVREAWDLGATEVCIQGGIDPRNDGRIYLEIARAVKASVPDMHLHGFSPLEVSVGARTLNLSLQRYIPMLAEAGLDTMPGTAAEILDGDVRHKITPEKLTADDWAEVMTTAHASGIRATTTIMFGHVDYPAAWAKHILRLRDIQERTGGFTEFVPLPFVHHRSPIFMRGDSRTGPTWRECVKIHAVGRVVLHPLITNIQGSWVKLGADGVASMLDAGVNDFGGTLMEEHISRMAGASHGLGMTVEQIEQSIRSAGRTPRERTTTYGTPVVPYRERIAVA